MASRKHGAAIEALQNTAVQIREEVAHRAEEAERCDLEIRCKVSELQAELLAADRSTRDQVHAGMLDMSERMKKEHNEARRAAEEQRGILDSRLQAETAALKKQLDSYHADSVERADTILRQAARKDQVNDELRNKVDKQDLARDMEVLKSTVLRKHDEIINELRAKADAPLLDKKANWETVTAALGTQEEALKGVRSVPLCLSLLLFSLPALCSFLLVSLSCSPFSLSFPYLHFARFLWHLFPELASISHVLISCCMPAPHSLSRSRRSFKD